MRILFLLLFSISAFAQVNVPANRVSAGPTTGTAAPATYRLLVPADIPSLDWSKIIGEPTTLAGYGITDGVINTRTINTTSPLTGGGDLSSDRTFAINNALADGVTKGAASFTAADFDDLSGNISIDYTNGQASSGSTKGFLTSADWTTFNNKQASGESWLLASGGTLTGPNTITGSASNTLTFSSTRVTISSGPLNLANFTNSSPSNGDVWFDGSNFPFMRIGGNSHRVVTALSWTANQIAYGSGTAAQLSSSPNLTFNGTLLTNANNSGLTVQLGVAGSDVSTATPLILSLGGTVGTTVANSLKLKIWDGTSSAGFGMSSGQLNYIVGSGQTHAFILGTSEAFRVSNGQAKVTYNGGTGTNPFLIDANSQTLGFDGMAMAVLSGAYTLQNTSGGTNEQIRLANTVTTSNTNQIIRALRNQSTYTVNHTGATVVGYYFGPTINGSQTPTHVYALQATTGKIGLANYTNSNIASGDLWFESGMPLIGISGALQRLAYTANPFPGANQIFYSSGSGTQLTASANLTFNGNTLTISPASATALSITPIGTITSLPTATIAGTFTVAGTDWYGWRHTSTITSGATNLNLQPFSSNGSYVINATGNNVIGFSFNVNSMTGSQQPASVRAYSHTSGYVQWASVLSPAQITSNQTDYNPTGWTNGGAPYGASRVRVTSDAARSIFSLGGGVDGRQALWYNVGSNPITFTDDDGATGTAAQRFDLPASFTTVPGEGVHFDYDNTSARWRMTGVHWLFSSTIKGLVPASGGGTTSFLRADGSWSSTLTTSLAVGGNTTAAGYIDWHEDSDNGSNRIRLQAPASISADKDFILPPAVEVSGFGLVSTTSGTMSFSGRSVKAWNSQTTTYTVTEDDYMLLGDATSGAFDFDLPTAASCSGCVFVIKKIDSTANAVNIDPNGTELIDGSSTSVSITVQWASKTIQSNGTSWFITSN